VTADQHADFRFLFYNTFLLRAMRVPIPGRGRFLHATPAVEARARELGRRLAGQYDVAALCEVFDHAERRAIVAGWGDRGRRAPFDVIGPEPLLPFRLPALKSSGLFTLVDGPAVTRTTTHLFRTRGDRLRDADAWANKGVLLVEVDVGLPANVEVYSTHLIWGGELVIEHDRAYHPAVFALRQAQAAELLAFVERTHTPGNVTLVVGDFNIDALDDTSAYADLAALMNAAGFGDVWAEHGDGPGYTCDVRVLRDAICVSDPECPDLGLEPAAPRSAEPAANDVGKRIDYVWLRADGDVTATVAAVRRALFPRPPDAPEVDKMPYLSDHLGLHVELTLSTP
jgi:endonuclease/exonuclease/phosphatase family metal-dependent hydrolase